MDKKLIKKLIRIADKLDEKGMSDMADKVDGVIEDQVVVDNQVNVSDVPKLDDKKEEYGEEWYKETEELVKLSLQDKLYEFLDDYFIHHGGPKPLRDLYNVIKLKFPGLSNDDDIIHIYDAVSHDSYNTALEDGYDPSLEEEDDDY